MQKIHPFLWFDSQAEEAMNFYCSVFRNAKAGSVVRHGDAGPGPKAGQSHLRNSVYSYSPNMGEDRGGGSVR
jgi:predicted 3-demethylubiquinone-9 3-methyltransferase (glyoxalase superfamily)